jgi:hypothetical protein
MSVAASRRARLRMKQRYKGGNVHLTVAEQIEKERSRAAREAARKSKRK